MSGVWPTSPTKSPTSRLCGRSIGVLTGRQGSLGLAVEHDVDAREGCVSEQGGGQSGEQSPDALCLVHAPHSPGHAHIIVSAALEHKARVRWSETRSKI